MRVDVWATRIFNFENRNLFKAYAYQSTNSELGN